MNNEEKLFAFMLHAENLQKIADESHKELQAATAAVKAMAKFLPAETSGAVSSTIGKIVDSRLIGPMEQVKAELGAVVGKAKSSTKGLWLYPIAIFASYGIAMGGLAYLGLHWLKEERSELKAEISALNHELAQAANVRKFTTEEGEDQFWVEIDPAKKTGDADGKTWARMPRR